MAEKSLLEGKRVLMVDDESDVLDTLEELLSMCAVVKASTFEEAKALLESQYFDIAVLDIMGVDGFTLLEIAVKRKIVAVMLTSHALSLENTVRSFKEGAASYIPKEEMENLPTYLNDILEAKEKGRSFWWRWLERFGTYYNKKFGIDWQNMDKEFYKELKYYDRQ